MSESSYSVTLENELQKLRDEFKIMMAQNMEKFFEEKIIPVVTVGLSNIKKDLDVQAARIAVIENKVDNIPKVQVEDIVKTKIDNGLVPLVKDKLGTIESSVFEHSEKINKLASKIEQIESNFTEMKKTQVASESEPAVSSVTIRETARIQSNAIAAKSNSVRDKKVTISGDESLEGEDVSSSSDSSALWDRGKGSRRSKSTASKGDRGPVRTKLIKIFSPGDHPSLALKNPCDAEAVIEFIENFEILAKDYPDGDCSMVKCLSTAAKNKMLAHGRTMSGAIHKACLSSLGLRALSEKGMKKLLYDMNKAKSATDMIAKMRRISFMQDGGTFVLSTANIPEFYEYLVLFNARFVKLLKCYCLRAKEECLPTLFKQNNVLGVWDYYLNALPSKSGRVFWEEIVSVKPEAKEYKTLDSLVELLRRHVEKKRRLALEFKDMGKSLRVRVEAVSSESSDEDGCYGGEDYQGSESYGEELEDSVGASEDEESSKLEEDGDSAGASEDAQESSEQDEQGSLEDIEEDMEEEELDSPEAWEDSGGGDY
jgi:hypothetical protein